MTQQHYRDNQAPYAGANLTFAFSELVLDRAGLQGADVAIIGAPFDEAVSNRPGTRFGPRAIRSADMMCPPSARPHTPLRIDPFAALRIVDHGDVMPLIGDLAGSHAALEEAILGALEAGALPLVLGGDHAISLPMLRALRRHYGADGYAVVHLDAHTDLEDTEGALHHGNPFSKAVQEGALDPRRKSLVGIRGYWPWSFAEEDEWRGRGVRYFDIEMIRERGLAEVLTDVIEHASAAAERVYLTVDIDVLEAAFAPGTGTPEPDGLTPGELMRAVRRLALELDLCALDLVEVSPPYDQSEVTALTANRVILEALAGIAARRRIRPA